jgi:hypothetical protein
MDSTTEVAGYLLGLFAIIVICIVCFLVFDDTRTVMIVGLSGAVFVTLIGWWPIWTMILLVIGMAIMLFRLPGLGNESAD